MSGYWLDIGLIGLLVLLNAAFAGSEMAMVSLREGQLRQLERAGGANAVLLTRLAKDPDRYLATTQIGITLAGFLASATAAVSLAEPLIPSLGALGSAAEPVAVASVTLVLVFLTLVLGELVPKRLAMQRAVPWALAVARPLHALSVVSRPAVALLAASTSALVRLLGGRREAAIDEIGADELESLITGSQALEPAQRDIVREALEIRNRTLREVLVPRGQVFRLDPELTLDAARAALAESGHSRAPVIDPLDTDHVIGVVHWVSVADGGADPVSSVVGPALALPGTLPVLAALAQFQTERQQLAVVVGEQGSIDGIVTVEDILEEIVGEIYDETDLHVPPAESQADGSIILLGTYPLHDLIDVGIDLGREPSRDYTTIAGLVLARLERVPEEPGATVPVGNGWTAEVLAVAHHAITRVRVRRVSEDPPS